VKRLIVVGAGDFGREVFAWLLSDQAALGEASPAGFIDDNLLALEKHPYKEGILGTIRDYRPREDDLLVMGIAQPRTKLRVASALEDRGARFLTFVHSSALISRNVSIGRGAVICPRAVVSCDVKLGAFVSLNVAATVGHDAELGEGCTISSHADITGHVKLGPAVFLGTHAAVLPSVVVEEGALVGAGSVAIRTVRANTTVMGVPAKAIS
jgi:sugar O-acyltransferase (sialic acid O-acetyltransferase NeuD family)